MTGIETNVAGKTAIVTGGSRGIGKAVATALAESGAQVMIVSRKAEVCEQAAVEIGHGCQWRAVNVTDGESAATVVSETVNEFGSVDILVNNAGTNPYAGPVIEADVPRWNKTFEVNLTSPLRWTQLVWEHSMKEHGGSVVNLASVGGFVTSRMIGTYNITKSALMHLTRQLAAELAPKVRVNAVAPGVVKTDFAKMLWEGEKEQTVAGNYPLERLGEVDDVANAVHFLASDAASWITGQTLVIDGGGLISFEEDL